jgi:hypothetical protein
MVNQKNLENNVRKLLQNSAYKIESQKVIKALSLRLSEEIHDPEIEYTASLLDAARVSTDDIENMIAKDSERLRQFCCAYIKAQPALDLGQEYNPNEDGDDGESSNEEYDGHSQTFLIQYASLYLLLSRQPDGLLDYLKKIREPKAPRQAALLKKFFTNFLASI